MLYTCMHLQALRMPVITSAALAQTTYTSRILLRLQEVIQNHSRWLRSFNVQMYM